MLKNYFKIAWRNMVKDKAYTALNIAGLATGMAVALVIGLWAFYQFSYNRFLPNYRQAYQVLYRLNRNGDIQVQSSTSLLLANVMKKDIPEIQYVAQSDWMSHHGLVVGDKKLYLKGVMASEDFLHVFQYPLLKGDASGVLKDPYSIVLTQSTAIALFGTDNVVNKTVRVDNLHDLKVTGILKDVPGNSSMQFNYIIPFSYRILTVDWVKAASTTWDNNSFQTFVALRPGVSAEQLTAKLKQIPKYFPDAWKIVQPGVILYPLKDWHLYDDFKKGVAVGGFIDYVRMFGIIGILVLLIACINFTNLSTARSERRAREVGVRKAVGSSRRSLIAQFLVESLVISCIALLFSLLLVQLALPLFNQLTGDTIAIPFENPLFWTVMVAYLLLTALLAGSRPAFYLSSFRPVKVLKGNLQTGNLATLPRKILVVLQFSCSIALIISTIIVYQQIQYAKNRPTGYDANRLMMTDASNDLIRNYTALKDDLLKSGMVSNVTRASSPATNIESWEGIDHWQGMYPNETFNAAIIDVGDDYFSTLGMSLLQGKNFTGNAAADSGTIILNEAAVKRMRLKDPVNQTILWEHNQPVRVIGVVKDALMLSPFSPAEPTFFAARPKHAIDYILYRLKPAVSTQDAIARLAKIFNQYNPAYSYQYRFADDSYASKFKLEMIVGKLAGIFAVLAVFISCMGLFGLAAYVAHQRTKEIGIRKVLGASVSQLWLLLSKEFIVLVIISCLIASPVAWYFLQGWLHQYNYRISIGPAVFILAAFITLLITVVTISFQAIKAALANPVNSLRTE